MGVFHFGRLPFWSSSVLVVFHSGRLPFWSFFHLGRLPFLSSSILVVFHVGFLIFWLSSILIVFHLMDKEKISSDQDFLNIKVKYKMSSVQDLLCDWCYHPQDGAQTLKYGTIIQISPF